MSRTIIVGVAPVPLKVAHCDCGEREFKASVSDGEIRAITGIRCPDCGCAIDVSLIPGEPAAPLAPLPRLPDVLIPWLGI